MMNKQIYRILSLMLCAVMAVSIAGCSGSKKETDLNALSLDEITAKAKEEGRIDSVGMPDFWANWHVTWADISEQYGLEHTDLDMSSAEEIALFEAEKNSPTKDIGDVGMTMAPIAVEKGVTQPYKTSYWDDIPDWAKDEEGHWIVAYLGTTSFMVNNEIIPNAPKSWKDIQAGDYLITIGDVSKSAQAQAAFVASAYAFGGDVNNLQPAVDFWKELAAAGRIDKGDTHVGRIEKGEAALCILWDYNTLGVRDSIKENNPNMSFTCVIPQDGAVQAGYATIINKWAPHPHAAALAREFILSDAGQLNLALGYATPIRDIQLPADIQLDNIPADQYNNAQPMNDFAAWDAATQQSAQLWQEEIIPLLQQ